MDLEKERSEMVQGANDVINEARAGGTALVKTDAFGGMEAHRGDDLAGAGQQGPGVAPGDDPYMVTLMGER